MRNANAQIGVKIVALNNNNDDHKQILLDKVNTKNAKKIDSSATLKVNHYHYVH